MVEATVDLPVYCHCQLFPNTMVPALPVSVSPSVPRRAVLYITAARFSAPVTVLPTICPARFTASVDLCHLLPPASLFSSPATLESLLLRPSNQAALPPYWL